MKNEEQICVCVCLCVYRAARLFSVHNKLVTHTLHCGFALPKHSLYNTLHLHLRAAPVIIKTFLGAFRAFISKCV